MCKLARLGCTQYPIWSALCLSLMLAITASAEDSNSLTYYSTSQFSVTEFDRKMYLRNAPPEAGGGIGVKVHPILRPTAFADGLGEGASEPFPNALHVENFTAGHQFAEVFGDGAQHSTCVLIGPNAKHVGALQFQQHRHLMEHVGHLIAGKERRAVGARLGEGKGTACHGFEG